MRKVEFRPRAALDVESIVTYISFVLAAPNAAQEWYGKLKESLTLLCEQPGIGRIFQDDRLELFERRTFLVGNYRIYYSFNESALTVWRILHTSQDMDDYALVDL